MSSPPKVPLQLQSQRQQRHNKLMKMINSYELTRQQKTKLQKIKSHTMMQINLRFLRSEVNRNFKFPKFSKSTDKSENSDSESYLNTTEEQDQEENRVLKQELEERTQILGRGKKRPAEYFVYDLRSQNHEKKQDYKIVDLNIKSFGSKIISLEQSRRVHSLGNERSKQKQKQDLIIRRHNPIKNSNERFAKSPTVVQSKSQKVIKVISQTRKPSRQHILFEQAVQKSPTNLNSKNLLIETRKLKLPEINSSKNSLSKSLKKLQPIHQKLKTQKIYEQEGIQYAIGKKLFTETNDSGKKTVKGVEKYLKQLQAQKQLNNLNNGKMMRKQRDSQKRRIQGDVFKTAKHSLKRQLQKEIC